MTVSASEYANAKLLETDPERIRAIGMVISWYFISCTGLHNLERSRDRKSLNSKGGQLRWFLSLIFGVFILANFRATLVAGPRKEIRKAGKQARLSAHRPDLCQADHYNNQTAAISYQTRDQSLRVQRRGWLRAWLDEDFNPEAESEDYHLEESRAK